jgi:hypothetical protein
MFGHVRSRCSVIRRNRVAVQAERTWPNQRERSPTLAMQKVVGSSPIIRLEKGPLAGLCSFVGTWDAAPLGRRRRACVSRHGAQSCAPQARTGNDRELGHRLRRSPRPGSCWAGGPRSRIPVSPLLWNRPGDSPGVDLPQRRCRRLGFRVPLSARHEGASMGLLSEAK